jgi:hypothetical protein
MSDKKLIEKARSMYAHDDLEVDDDAKTIRTGDQTGYWVQAWVFVPAEETVEEL